MSRAAMPKSIHRPEYEALRRLLRQARDDAGVSQVELSAALGRSQSFVSDIERGVRRLDAIEMRDICQILDRDFLEFMAELESEISALQPIRAGRVRRRKPR